MPGCDGVWCGSEGVGEGLVGGYGGEYGVFVGVGVGYGAVSSDAGVDVAACEVLVDVWPGLGESGVPVFEEVVGFEAGGVFVLGEGYGGGGDLGFVGLVEDFCVGRLVLRGRRRMLRLGGGRRR